MCWIARQKKNRQMLGQGVQHADHRAGLQKKRKMVRPRRPNPQSLKRTFPSLTDIPGVNGKSTEVTCGRESRLKQNDWSMRGRVSRK